MEYNINKICRVCLEEGAHTSVFSTEFAMMPSTMMMMCAKIKVYKSDELPAVICNNCIYRLGVAYHFKQECENSDIRLRQHFGIQDRTYGCCDAETNTDSVLNNNHSSVAESHKNYESDNEIYLKLNKSKRTGRYKRKPQEEYKKRGPKPTPKLPHTCYDCHKSFKCSAQLQMHVRTHTGEKPFICNYCPRRFAQKYNLKIHVRTHTGERPFQCEICSKQFSALGNFQAHQRIHTGVRNKSCLVCRKAFYSIGDLSKHMVIHTGIKNHHCNLCGKSFSRQRDMQLHKRKFHAFRKETVSEKGNVVDGDHVKTNSPSSLKCTDCHKGFTSSNCFTSHFRSNNLIPAPLSAQVYPQDHHYTFAADSLHYLHSAASLSSTNNLASTSQPIPPPILTHSIPPNVACINHTSAHVN